MCSCCDADSGSSAFPCAREMELFEQARHDEAARSELIARYLPLANKLAYRYARRGEDTDDLRQVAAVGLLKAMSRFDPARGVRFTSYASALIIGELRRHFRDYGWTLQVPRHLKTVRAVVERTVEDLSQKLGRAPTIAEIVTAADLNEAEVIEALNCDSAYTPASLDATLYDDDPTTLSDRLGGEDPLMWVTEELAALEPAVSQLPARSQAILYLRFFCGMTQSEIARQVGISQMHVSRLLRQSLEMIRSVVESDT